MNPYVFVVGCPRSGTTLVQKILGAHPQLALTDKESHWISECYEKKTGVDADGHVARDLSDVICANPRYHALGFDRAQLDDLVRRHEGTPYAQFVTLLFDELARTEGKPFAGDKTPAYVFDLGLLHELWPWARFVHVIRDGRDVCLSALSWTRKAASFARRLPTWSDDRVTTIALWWKLHVANGREQGRRLPEGTYFELRYESLVNDPRATCDELCSFLGLAYHDAMLRFHEGRMQAAPGVSAKHAWLPVTPGLRDWRRALAPDDLRRFEAAAGELLEELGYGLGAARLTSDDAAHAARIEERFVSELPRRERPRAAVLS